MSNSESKNVRSWSGPIEQMAEDERRALIEFHDRQRAAADRDRRCAAQ